VDTMVMMAIFTEVKGKVNHSDPNLHLATQLVLASTTCHKNFSSRKFGSSLYLDSVCLFDWLLVTF